MPHYKSYIICTSPRSGSTLACKLLEATGESGFPDSHFHSPAIADWMRYYDIANDITKTERELLLDIFHAARIRGTGDTGIFGLRLQGHSFNYFIQKLRILIARHSSDVERIHEVFGTTLFIHLTRQNKVEQAVSYVKASQTGLWHKASNGLELERSSLPQEPSYDAAEIKRQLIKLSAMDEMWNSWFAKEKLNPLTITYEDLSSNPIAITETILEHLGVNTKLTKGLRMPVSKLADSTSTEWVSRFFHENVHSFNSD